MAQRAAHCYPDPGTLPTLSWPPCQTLNPPLQAPQEDQTVGRGRPGGPQHTREGQDSPLGCRSPGRRFRSFCLNSGPPAEETRSSRDRSWALREPGPGPGRRCPLLLTLVLRRGRRIWPPRPWRDVPSLWRDFPHVSVEEGLLPPHASPRPRGCWGPRSIHNGHWNSC